MSLGTPMNWLFHAIIVDPILCNLFLEELDQSWKSQEYQLWAYVLMPNHVHMLIWPKAKTYKIADILQDIKGKASKRYLDFILQAKPELFAEFCITKKGQKTFSIWQAGGGFDRNLWNSKPIHHSIEYIEGNPVRAGLVNFPEEWRWSSAWTRKRKCGLIPDDSDIPMFMKL